MTTQLSQKLLDTFNPGAGLTADINILGNFFNVFSSSLPGNVYCLDANANALFGNKNVLDMCGLDEAKDFIGLSFADMCDLGEWELEAAESFKADTLEVIETGQPKLSVVEPPIPHANGEIIHFLSSRMPVFDKTGEVAAVIGNSVDITDVIASEKKNWTHAKIRIPAMQRKALALYNEGFPHKEAAYKLNISVTTYAWYLRQIREKYGIRTRREMLELEQGLV